MRPTPCITAQLDIHMHINCGAHNPALHTSAAVGALRARQRLMGGIRWPESPLPDQESHSAAPLATPAARCTDLRMARDRRNWISNAVSLKAAACRRRGGVGCPASRREGYAPMRSADTASMLWQRGQEEGIQAAKGKEGTCESDCGAAVGRGSGSTHGHAAPPAQQDAQCHSCCRTVGGAPGCP